MLPSALRQTMASVFLMSSVYLSNLMFNITTDLNNTNYTGTSLNDSIFSYPVSVLLSVVSADDPDHGTTENAILGVCRTLYNDDSLSRIVGSFYDNNDHRVFFSDSLGRHCRVKLNLTIDAYEYVLRIYDTFVFPINLIYETTYYEDNVDDNDKSFTRSINQQDLNFQPKNDASSIHYLNFINKTGIELSFNAHVYDDVSTTLVNSGMILYAIRDSDTMYIIVIAERLKLYIIRYNSEQSLSKNYESHVFRVLRNEPDCSKYIHCTNHVKKYASTQ